MTHLFINALAASAGGGLTYIRNVIPHLGDHQHVRVTTAINSGLRREFGDFRNIEFLELDTSPSKRFWYEQTALPRLIRRSKADVVLSAGNFALRNSPVPQILLSRNSLYLSQDFFADLKSRGEYRMWMDTRARGFLAKKSIRWADVTVAPSEAFARDLERWSGARISAIHHGFDADAFTRDQLPLPEQLQSRLKTANGYKKILFVSHYNYYRNFETLIRALPVLREAGASVRLLLTCELAAGMNPGAYRPDRAACLIKDFGVRDMVIELGAVPYQKLHQLYAMADIYVTPAYTETFAHPLVEAMASGVPVVASDIPVHREICGEAGLFFDRFSPDALASCVMRVMADIDVRSLMVARGRLRANDFSWKAHVEKILQIADRLVTPDAKMAAIHV